MADRWTSSYFRFVPRAISIPADYYVWSGDGHFSNGRLISAIDCYSIALDMEPDNIDALYNRGWAHYAANYYDAALDDFNDALEYKPDSQVIMEGIEKVIESMNRVMNYQLNHGRT